MSQQPPPQWQGQPPYQQPHYSPGPGMMPPKKKLGRRTWLIIVVVMVIFAVISVATVIKTTQGTPHLGGPVSDFYSKYGAAMNGVQPPPDAPPDAFSSADWLIDPNNAGGSYTLTVQYSGSAHVVNDIVYGGPSNWSLAQYRDFLIATFAPPGTVEDTKINSSWKSQGGDPYNPIVYDSTIGKFYLHISYGFGDMSTPLIP